MNRRLVVAFSSVVVLAACKGFKDAMTAHVDTVASAASQDLSVTRLSDLIGKSAAPLRKDVVQTVAELWVTYQLLGRAAADGDSLSSPKLVNDAMWPAITSTRTKKLYDLISKDWTKTDTTKYAEAYARGDLLSARHILFNAPPDSTSPAAQDALKKANSVRPQVTSANFAQMATKYNQPNAAGPGGDLGVFQHGQMVKEFERALVALKPGEISPLIRTQFGYHIIRRSTYDEVKTQFAQTYPQLAAHAAESTYVAKMEAGSKVEVKPGAAAAMKAYAANPDAKANDKTVLATSVLGDFTVARAAKWIGGFPQPAQVRQQMAAAPDSIFPVFIRQLVRNDLLLHQADSAKVQLDSAELSDIRKSFVTVVTNGWNGLGVAPKQLADSAKTVGEREKLAATRIEDYVDRLVTKNEQFVQVPPPVANALRAKYDWKLNPAGVDRALERAQKIRQTADSVKKATQPPTAIPMPGAGPATPPPSGAPPVPAGKAAPPPAPSKP